jgi:hypothetical protein
MPLQATSGAASYDAFGGGVPVSVNYIEDVFSTYLYTGTGVAQTITNGIDVSTKGGLTWIKGRSGATGNRLTDTARGATKSLASNSILVEATESTGLTAFGTTGFTIGADADYNTSAATYASWTFRKQPKFFDIVTYSGNSATTQEVAHSLGSVPACIIVKPINAEDDWFVYHRSSPSSGVLKLNRTDAANTSIPQYVFGNGTVAVAPTSTVFTVSGDGGVVNNTGTNYIAYLFAHDAGGFGLTGTDNVISCGSYVGTGSPLTVTLGYEPQWVLIKRASTGANNWILMDTMRGMSLTQANWLYPNTSDVEVDSGVQCNPTATGFTITATGSNLNSVASTYIYIAIRKGPMKVPTSGTSVFNAISRSGTGAAVSVTGTGFPPDLLIAKVTNFNGAPAWFDKLRGPNRALTSNTTDVEETTTTEISSFNQDGFSAGTSSTYYTNASGGYTYINWQLKRAPSFFDEVCYTGTSSATTFSHNLQAVPELMICKKRNTSASWIVYSAPTGNSAILQLEDTGAVQTSVSHWNNTTPTSSVFSVGTQGSVNSGDHVMYLFATCAGVSKVGSYTGTGTLTTINCGFTGGARFVLIKRTDSTGAWYVWDTIRGMVAATDPSLRFNSGGSESNANSVYTIATGFQLLASPAVDVNTNGGSYIFLAIA